MPAANRMATSPQPGKAATFGERLKRERELRGIKLEEIAESTKIGKRNLVALEEEEFSQLPGGIFNKGFVRAYAKFLGLDEEQAVNDFLAASANSDQPAALQPLASPLASMVKPAVIPSDDAVRRKDLRWALAAILALLALGLWLFANHGGFERLRQRFRGASSVTEVNAAASDAAAPPTSASAAPNSASPAAVAKTAVAKTVDSSLATREAAARGASPAKTASQSLKLATADTVLLRIHATEDSWISVKTDGVPVADSLMRSGQTRQFQAAKELALRTGNAGALELWLNGKPLPALGADDEVKSVTFTSSATH